MVTDKLISKKFTGCQKPIKISGQGGVAQYRLQPGPEGSLKLLGKIPPTFR
jgi:hypothetical protein